MHFRPSRCKEHRIASHRAGRRQLTTHIHKLVAAPSQPGAGYDAPPTMETGRSTPSEKLTPPLSSPAPDRLKWLMNNHFPAMAPVLHTLAQERTTRRSVIDMECHMSVQSVMAAGLAGVTLALFAASAGATVQYQGANTYLGAFTVPPGTPSGVDFSRAGSGTQNPSPGGFPAGNFDDYWLFTISPAASVDMSVNFVPIGSISGPLTGGIYETTGTWTCTAGGTCTGGGFAATAKVEGPVPGLAFPGLSTLLTAGTYALRIQGTNNNATQTAYTGQLAFRAVPEPTTLALLGLGVIGLGLSRRRRG